MRMVAALALLWIAGCSAQQWYATGQSWQRQECLRLLSDAPERDRCMKSTARSYDDYRAEAAKAGGNLPLAR
jgi:hypothetical protein